LTCTNIPGLPVAHSDIEGRPVQRQVFEKRPEGATMGNWISPGIRAAVRRDLASISVPGADGIGRSALLLARMLDSGELEPREAVTAARELRVTMTGLLDLAPPRAEGSIVDELRARRSARSAAG
jgi:hypothetical protein